MKTFLIFIFHCLSVSCFSQKAKQFKFVVYDPVIIDSSTGFYSYKPNEYSFYREYLAYNLIREKGVFGGDTSSSNTNNLFKIVDRKWYVRKNSGWYTFFNNGKPVRTTIKIDGDYYSIKWKATGIFDTIPGIKIYKITFLPIGFSTSGTVSYYFSPKDGVVAVDGHDVFLVREDKVYMQFYDKFVTSKRN